MTRKTSIEAYNKIKENGLLSKRRFQVYEYLYKNGPCIARQIHKDLAVFGTNVSGYMGRLSELRDAGVVAEVGKVVDKETGHKVLLWDVTKNLPVKLEKPKRIKCKVCNGKGYSETQQGRIF